MIDRRRAGTAIKQKQPTRRRKALLITSIIFAAAVISAGGWFTYDYFFAEKSITRPIDPTNPDALHPYFSFDAAKSPGWFSAINSSSKGATVYEDSGPVPTVGFTVAEGESLSHPKQDGCFIMYSLYDAPATIEARERYKHRFDTVPQSGIGMEETGVVQASLATPEGTKSFELHTQHYINNTEPIMEGGATGYAPLSNGFVEVQAICRTVDEIQKVIPVISSVTLLP